MIGRKASQIMNHVSFASRSADPYHYRNARFKLKTPPKLCGKRRSITKMEALYEMLAPGSHNRKVSPTTSTIKEAGKGIVAVRNNDIAKLGTQQEHQTVFKLIEEGIQCHNEDYTQKLKEDKKRNSSDETQAAEYPPQNATSHARCWVAFLSSLLSNAILTGINPPSYAKPTHHSF